MQTVLDIIFWDYYPGLFTGRGYGSGKEAACEGVVFYVEQAAMKPMP